MIQISNSNPADTLRQQGQLRFEVTGSSMQPLLNAEKHTVHISYLKEEPQALDVVLFRREDGSFVLHRILSVCGDLYTLCGDNQTKEERGITRQQICGRMEGYYRGERYHSCSSIPYRMYVRIWKVTMPMRRMRDFLRRSLKGEKQ